MSFLVINQQTKLTLAVSKQRSLPLSIVYYEAKAEKGMKNSLANINFNKNEHEEEKRGRSGSNDHPDGKILAEGADEPPTSVGVRRLQALRHTQLIRVRLADQKVQEHHEENGNWNAEVTQRSTHLQNKKLF